LVNLADHWSMEYLSGLPMLNGPKIQNRLLTAATNQACQE